MTHTHRYNLPLAQVALDTGPMEPDQTVEWFRRAGITATMYNTYFARVLGDLVYSFESDATKKYLEQGDTL